MHPSSKSECCTLQQLEQTLPKRPSDPVCKYSVPGRKKGHICLSATLCCVNRFRLAGEAEDEAQQRKQHLQTHVLQLQQQLKDQECVLADTKEQVFFLFVFAYRSTL